MVFFLSHPTQLSPPSCPPIRVVPDRQQWPWTRLCSRRKGKSRSCLYFISSVIARVEKKRKRSSAAEVVRFEFKVNERELQLLFWNLMQPPVLIISRYVRERSSGKDVEKNDSPTPLSLGMWHRVNLLKTEKNVVYMPVRTIARKVKCK